MNTALRSVNIHTGSNSFTGYFSVNDANIAFVISLQDSLIIEPLREDDTALHDFLSAQSADFSIKAHITQLFIEWCDLDFNERLRQDSQRGIVVGSIQTQEYRLYPIPDMLLRSASDIQKLVNQTIPLLSKGEEILNHSTIKQLTGEV